MTCQVRRSLRPGGRSNDLAQAAQPRSSTSKRLAGRPSPHGRPDRPGHLPELRERGERGTLAAQEQLVDLQGQHAQELRRRSQIGGARAMSTCSLACSSTRTRRPCRNRLPARVARPVTTLRRQRPLRRSDRLARRTWICEVRQAGCRDALLRRSTGLSMRFRRARRHRAPTLIFLCALDRPRRSGKPAL